METIAVAAPAVLVRDCFDHSPSTAPRELAAVALLDSLEPANSLPPALDEIEEPEPAYVPPQVDLGPAEADDEEDLAAVPSGGGWTIPLLCAGIAMIACCVLIPQADENRRLTYERAKLKQDLQYVQRQVAVNDEFLHKVADDPTLAERLAQRQMKVIRQGTAILRLRGDGQWQEMSPFLLVNVAPPPPMPAYRPIGGKLAALCRDPKQRLYVMGGALLLMACGLILGGTRRVSES
jgi:hypothetical protein